MKRTKNRGAVLLIVLGMIFLMSLILGTMMRVTNQSAYRVKKTYHTSRAIALAEAGIADIVDIMHTNYSAGVGVQFTRFFGDGQYYVTSSLCANQNVIIRSEGVYRKETRETSIELLGNVYDIWDEYGSSFAILSGGNVTLDTAAPIINNGIHANGNILHSRGNIEVFGDISACGIVQIASNGIFTVTESARKLLVPDPDLSLWRTAAINGGLYYDTSQSFGGVNLIPANGIVYVDGDITIDNASSLHGTLVASGTININNKFDQTSYKPNWPAIMAGIDVNLLNRNRYSGMIYAKNDITIRNNKVIDGIVISGNNVNIDGKVEILDQSDPPEWTPNGNPDPVVIVGGWLK